jgi:large subunit ribosomal protein L28
MARVCEYCRKGTRSGGSIARRGLPKKKGGVGLNITGRSKRKFKPNVQRARALIDGEVRRVKICTRCMKSGKIVKPALSA